MKVAPAEVSLAYTYAWWLTGVEQSARAAVLAATDRPEVPGADLNLRIEILLRRVRGAAITEPTMCPASELALLHDALGLGLHEAAGLTQIDARDARTELAHGRLEALGPDAEFQITDPQRLGGLAVGNPADVAAARQNPQLAHLRRMILRGRDEVLTVAATEVPADLLRAVAARGAHESSVATRRARDSAVPPRRAPAGAVAALRTHDGAPAASREAHQGLVAGVPDEDDWSAEADVVPATPADPARPILPTLRSRRLRWGLVGLVVIVGVLALLTSRDGPGPGADPGPGPGAHDSTEDMVSSTAALVTGVPTLPLVRS